MRQSSSWVRYTIALFALLAGLILSIRWSERGVLLESPSATALSANTNTDDTWDLEALRVFNQVLLQVRANYVEPDRVDPRRMLVHALDRVQNHVPEIVALFDDELESDPSNVEVTVGSATRDFDLTDVKSHWQLAFKLREIFAFIDEHIDKDSNDLQKVEYAAVNGMLTTLDPHSTLLNPDLFEDMQAANRGSFGGLGIVISLRDDQLTVISPIANTPAALAGFKTGDRIVKINDESTINMPLDEAVSRLRGAPGSKVTLQIERDGWSEPHEFELEREIINIESVQHEQLDNGIGYISIQNFQGNTHDDLLKALSDLRSNGDIKGLILDLRNDPGGLLQQAILVTDTFLSEGTIVTTVGVGSKLREHSSATRANTEPEYPIVVLTNAGTASASEIVAGALKAHDRAIVVGDVTFGKGSVQNLYPFRDGSALKLTIAQYLTPGDISIQGVGVTPDIHLVPATITDDSVDLYPPDHITRENALDAALTNAKIRETEEQPSSVVRYYQEAEETDASQLQDPNEFRIDFEIGFAESLLRSAGDTFKRPAMLNKIKSTIERADEEQSLRIQEQLRQRNVDWSSGPTVRQPLDVEITTSSKDNRVDAGETITITAKVTNKGDEPLYRVRAVSQSDYDLLDDRELVFGHIPPGKTRSWSIDVEVPAEAPSRIDEIALQFWSDTVDLEHESSTKIRVHGLERPHWGFSWWIDDSEKGNGDGQLQVGETVKFHMLVSNTGAGDSGETVTYIRNRSDASVFIHQGRDAVDQIASGDAVISTFEFTVQKEPEDGYIELDAEILDTDFREFVSESLEIPVLSKEDTLDIEPIQGVAKVTASNQRIYPQPNETRSPLAEAQRGTALNVDAKTEGWYRVRWDDERVGWLPQTGVKLRDKGSAASGTPKERLQHQAPIVELEQNVLEVSSKTFNLRGIVSDESKVQNYYVLVNSRVSPHRRQTTKRAYRAVNSNTATIDVDVPLLPGSNEIIVVAQDDENVSSTARLHVFRNGEDAP